LIIILANEWGDWKDFEHYMGVHFVNGATANEKLYLLLCVHNIVAHVKKPCYLSGDLEF
jgi:hypothetical protein